MNTDPIHGPSGVSPQPGASAPPEQSEGVDFRRLLEKLEELQPDPAQDQHELHRAKAFFDAMKQADDEYHTVMDLRQQLEEAYRSRQG